MASAEHPSNRVTVLEALRTAKFPATRDELVAHAREFGADEMTLEELAGLPADTYESAADLAPLLGPVPPSGAGSGPRGLSTAGDDLGEHPSMVDPPD
jgi:hypothetical protein